MKKVLHLDCRRNGSSRASGDRMYKIMILQVLVQALQHVGILDASARLETCRKVVRRAEKVRDLQHAHVHDNRGQLVLAAEAALNDVHSQGAD